MKRGSTSGTSASILWRRLNQAGHDACRLTHERERWRLEGVAAFCEHASVVQLAYRVTCDALWRTIDAHVHGSLGSQPLDIGIRRAATGVWIMNGEALPGLHDCLDVDLGFSPSTNALHIRRISLEIGQRAEVPVAWVDIFERRLNRLAQSYERRSEKTYWYEAPQFGYADTLVVNEVGFPTQYPGLWQAESGG